MKGNFQVRFGERSGETRRLQSRKVRPAPTLRSGSLLIKCAQQVGSPNYALYGQENNGSTWALAMMNMFLHNVNQARIDWGDTLKHPTLLEGDQLMRFNVVVANPPFSLDKWGAENGYKDRYDRFWRSIPPKTMGDYAFISHMIESTYTDPSQNGRVGVIVPNGVLFRGGAEGKIRQALLEENLFDAVIGLPPNLFYGTGIPAAILIFKRSKSDDTVLFIDASRDFEPGKNQNRLRNQDIAKIVTTYQQCQNVAKYASVATFAEIKANDFNLNIPRYVNTLEDEVEVDLTAVQANINGLEVELAKVQQKMLGYLEELGLNG
jgi:type I restriction enzyme M protein